MQSTHQTKIQTELRSPSHAPLKRRWGVILAGGDGTRLRDLTRLVAGDARPKQFCRLFGDCTLVEQTRLRAERSIPAGNILFPVTAVHRAFYQREPGIRPSQRIVQPANKGTAPPIVHSLLSIQRQDNDAIVAVLPCDHHYSDEPAFTAALESAFETAARCRDSVVLLGSPARAPQTEYGWIELGPPFKAAPDFKEANAANFFEVRGFCEKPSADLALLLFQQGALWNTFVMIGHVRAFLGMVAAARTGLLKAFASEYLWDSSEVQIPGWLYERIYASDFSRDVLSHQAGSLIVSRMDDVEWSDLGHPERVIDVLQAAGLTPWWAREWHASKRPPASALPRTESAVA